MRKRKGGGVGETAGAARTLADMRWAARGRITIPTGCAAWPIEAAAVRRGGRRERRPFFRVPRLKGAVRSRYNRDDRAGAFAGGAAIGACRKAGKAAKAGGSSVTARRQAALRGTGQSKRANPKAKRGIIGMTVLIGAVEAGGTKFVCGIGNENGDILERVSFPTEAPDATLKRTIDFFRGRRVAAIGIGSFGPIDVNPDSPTYGHVTTTPKPGWNGFDFLGAMKREIPVPYGWDTDVNAAVLGEARWGAASGLKNCLYYTIGTGVGVGVLAEGRLVHGLVHPEGGHVPVRRHPEDAFEGNCPYHGGDCLEGMAAGPALEKRWGVKAHLLPPDHRAWEIEAHYLAEAIAAAVLLLSPQKVILGGGVMKQAHLFPMIRKRVQRLLNGYVQSAAITERIDDYIVPPGLGDNAGLAGALALGIGALEARAV